MALMVEVENAAAGWLATALAEMRLRHQQLGMRPPESMIELEKWASRKAKESHPRSVFAPVVEIVDADVVNRLVGYREAAEYLGVSRSTFGRLVTSSAIPTVRTHDGARPKVRLSDVDAYRDSLTPVDRGAA